jgi:CBS domain containing-hemolysin-like protein
VNADALILDAGRVVFATLLVLTNGFFVAAEIAMVRIRETQLSELERRGVGGAAAARTLRAQLNSAIATTQVGVTFASLLLGWLVEPLVGETLDPVLRWVGLGGSQVAHRVVFGLGFLMMSFVLIVAGEMAPKALALRQTEAVALATARPLLAAQWLFRPLIWIVEHAAHWILERFGVSGSIDDVGQSLEEIRLMLRTRPVRAGGDLGRDIVINALDLRRRVVGDVMRPRREITALGANQTIEACFAVAERSRYSRFPLCEGGDLDRTLGVVHCKDLFAARGRAVRGADLLSVAKPLIYVPETARLERLLELFLERRLHLAVVVDEFGGTTGLITLENILEELVGQIQDEFDQEKPRISARSDDVWELDGALPLFELGELVGERLESSEATTVGGWATQRLGGFPRRGDVVPLGAWMLVIEELDGLRVSRAALQRVAGPPADAPQEPPAGAVG